MRGINTSIVMERLGNLFLKLDLLKEDAQRERVRSELSLIQETADRRVDIALRTPTFCPGCPHRDSASVSLKLKKEFSDADYMREKHDRAPTDIIFHGESGCHSMLQFAPNEGLMQNYSGMGLGGGTGAGIDPFINNKQVVFLGDSTFFHSGMVAISDSIKNHQDITYIILDNKTTAMTGHQPTPGNDFDVMGRRTFQQNLETVVRGMAGGADVPILRTNPAERDSYEKLWNNFVLKTA